MLIQVVSSTGLILDIIGVFGLFYSRDKGLEVISQLNVYITSTSQFGHAVDDKIRIEIRNLKTEINSIIDKTARNNQRIFKRSKWWISLIVLGFVLQIASIFLPKCS